MILESTSLFAFVFTLHAAERIRSGMNKNVLFQISSSCERELTLRASERLLTRMYQYVCLEGTSLCAFVFTLVAAERLFSGMNKNVFFHISCLGGRECTHGASIGLISSLLCFGFGCERRHYSRLNEKLAATSCLLGLPTSNGDLPLLQV